MSIAGILKCQQCLQQWKTAEFQIQRSSCILTYASDYNYSLMCNFWRNICIESGIVKRHSNDDTYYNESKRASTFIDMNLLFQYVKNRTWSAWWLRKHFDLIFPQQHFLTPTLTWQSKLTLRSLTVKFMHSDDLERRWWQLSKWWCRVMTMTFNEPMSSNDDRWLSTRTIILDDAWSCFKETVYTTST